LTYCQETKEPLLKLLRTAENTLSNIEVIGEPIDSDNKPIKQNLKDYLFAEIEKTFGPSQSNEKSKLQQWLHQNSYVESQTPTIPKAIKLVELLRGFKNQTNFKAIVFVQTRESAFRLLEFLRQKCVDDLAFIKPEVITGHTGKTNDGMTISKQQNAIKNFTLGMVHLHLLPNNNI
jgi:ERCC4-related helicase